FYVNRKIYTPYEARN
ncbi:hypothetical protein TNCT_130401, partial [Trichonephila clavata]